MTAFETPVRADAGTPPLLPEQSLSSEQNQLKEIGEGNGRRRAYAEMRQLAGAGT
jgi:hypothetical protein